MKVFINKIIVSHPRLWEIFKFLAVGGIATLIDMLVMAAVIFCFNAEVFDNNFINVFLQSSAKKHSLMPYSSVIGTGAGFLCGLVFNYLMSVLIVFDHNKYAKTYKGALLFTLLSVIGFLIHLGGMWLFFEWLKINYWAVKIVITLGVLVFNYITRKMLVFTPDKHDKADKPSLQTDNIILDKE